MKVEAGKGVIWVYPYVAPEAEAGPSAEFIVIYPNKSIQLVRSHAARMDAEAARRLALALRAAAEMAEKGRE